MRRAGIVEQLVAGVVALCVVAPLLLAALAVARVIGILRHAAARDPAAALFLAAVAVSLVAKVALIAGALIVGPLVAVTGGITFCVCYAIGARFKP